MKSRARGFFLRGLNSCKTEHEVPVAKEHALKELCLMEPVYEVLDPDATVTFDVSEPGKRGSRVLLKNLLLGILKMCGRF